MSKARVYPHALVLALVMVASGASTAAAQAALGTARNYGVLGASAVTNTGPTTINGDLGVAPGTSITGAGSITLTGSIHQGDAVAQQAQDDASAAYTSLSTQPYTADLTGQNLGNRTLTPGIYFFASAAQLTGSLFLDFLGDPQSIFIFQIGSTLTTASSAIVAGIDGVAGDEVYWLVGSSATLGTGTSFRGSIIARQSVTLTTAASIACGRAIALTGAVTLDHNVVSTDGCSQAAEIVATPEPSAVLLLGSGLIALTGFVRRRVAA